MYTFVHIVYTDLYTKHSMRLSGIKVLLNEFKVQKEAIIIKTKFTYLVISIDYS